MSSHERFGTLTRGQVIGGGLLGAAAFAWPFVRSWSASASATSGSLSPFVERLPLPGEGIVVARPVAPGRYAFRLRPISRRLHPDLPKTPLWAYDDGSGLAGQAGSFGMVIPAETGSPLHVSHTNRLPRYPRRRDDSERHPSHRLTRLGPLGGVSIVLMLVSWL